MSRRLKKHISFWIHQKHAIVLLNNHGAIAVEYALSMIIAAGIMLGVLEVFTRMSLDIFSKVLKLLQTYP